MGLLSNALLVILSFATWSGCINYIDFEERWITRPPTEYEFPHAIYIFVRRTGEFCSGALVAESWVLTAAVCLYKDRTHILDNFDRCLTLYAGVKNRSDLNDTTVQMRQSERVRLPEEEQGWNDHSPAAVRVEKPFILNRKLGVDLIHLTRNSYRNTDHYQCKGGSYGNLQWDDPGDYLIKKRDLRVRECNCTKELKEAFPKSPVPKLICAQSKGASGICKGDFGLGMICDGALQAICVGLVRFQINSCIIQDKYSQSCWRDNSKGLFIDMCFYLNWMNEFIPGIQTREKECASTGYQRRPSLGLLYALITTILPYLSIDFNIIL